MELSRVKQIAIELMEKHGLRKGLPTDWRFEFDAARSRFGVCRHGSRVIGISQYLAALNGEDQVTNTVLHEIAHALVGFHVGHGSEWKMKAREIGCDGLRCYNSVQVARPEARLTYVCPKCGVKVKRNRRFPRPVACGYCCEKYNRNKFSTEFVLIQECVSGQAGMV